MKKKIIVLFALVFAVLLTSCTAGDMAQMSYQREAQDAKYTSEYARTVNKLEKAEGDFKSLRRVIFYNVRLGETVFSCEGFCHVQIDDDGDVELVIKTGPDSYLRHYLGQKQDITYFSEQISSNNDIKNYRYQITFNPKLWVPDIVSEIGR